MEYRPALRIRIILIVITLLFLILVGRLFFVQVIRGPYYANKADRQYQMPSGDLLDRGTIFFQTKDGQLVSAATMQDGFILAVNSTLIKNAEEAYQKINQIISLDHDSFITKAQKPNDPHEEILPRLDKTKGEAINKLKIPGVMLIKTRWRAYPGHTLGAQVLGLVSNENNDYVGRYGLERYYDQSLTRLPDKGFISFIAEAFSEIGGSVTNDQKNKGNEANLVLTIEPTVQQTLEQSLVKIQETYNPESAGGIIMDPKTGEILAMAALPTFDPGEKIPSLAVLKNPLAENVYEMGSIFKPLTLGAALDAGVIKPTTTYNDAGVLTIDGKQVYNFDGKGRGVVTMQTVLNQSLNTGAVFAMQQLGKNKFRQYFNNYGLGEKTGIDLPNEASGLLKNLNSPRSLEYATASFGQGIAVSPLEMIRALASLGNGGLIVKPHLVKRLERDNTKLSTTIVPITIRQVIKPETSQTITKMLVNTFDEGVLNGQYKQEHYSIAAKTGTAQMSNPATGSYYDDRYLHSFFGYFPASSPRFITFLYIVYPKNVQYASHTLTGPFMDLTKFLLNYYNIPPDR
jgi:cell division protein FtsI (penicillin-binding protein 3)/stage V sporulation protein D (sporulation-specific penicillin-binding protein)